MKTRSPIRSSLPCIRYQHPYQPPIPPDPTKTVNDPAEGFEEVADASNNAFTNLSCSPMVSLMFERGRFYELYSARRNERLKRKQIERNERLKRKKIEFTTDATAVAENPGVAVELAKRRHAKKAAESVRKSVPASFSVSRTSSLRSPATMVRSSKEMKKGTLAAGSCQKAAPADAGKRMGTRSVRRI